MVEVAEVRCVCKGLAWCAVIAGGDVMGFPPCWLFCMFGSRLCAVLWFSWTEQPYADLSPLVCIILHLDVGNKEFVHIRYLWKSRS